MTKLIKFLAAWLVLCLTVILFLSINKPVQLAAAQMLIFLTVIWIVICGSLMYSGRNVFWKYYVRIRMPFWLKFTSFATLFALIEEAIAVGINNYYYPITQGVVKLTASTNYWEVVSKHSVVAFIIPFLIFSFCIKYFKISPPRAFLYFGIFGVIAESTLSGFFAVLVAPLWIFVYGLMVYLPSKND